MIMHKKERSGDLSARVSKHTKWRSIPRKCDEVYHLQTGIADEPQAFVRKNVVHFFMWLFVIGALYTNAPTFAGEPVTLKSASASTGYIDITDLRDIEYSHSNVRTAAGTIKSVAAVQKLTEPEQNGMCRVPLYDGSGAKLSGSNRGNNSGFYLTGYSDLLWATPVVNIEFLNGTEFQRNLVKQAAKEWEACTGLRFRYYENGVRAPKQDITVSFGNPASKVFNCHSEIGILSSKKRPSMLLQNFEHEGSSERISGVGNALHELGHALGFAHEHQNPTAGFQWDRRLVADYLMGPPNYWKMEDVFRNVFNSVTGNVAYTGYDRFSIMAYFIRPGWLADDKSFSQHKNMSLSTKDKEFAGKWYSNKLRRIPIQPGPQEKIPIRDIVFVDTIHKVNYIQDIKPPQGYFRLSRNLNSGTGSNTEIHLYYTYGGKKAPITDLQIVSHQKAAEAKKMVRPGYELIEMDLNKGAGGHFIYLAVKRGAGTPITGIKLIAGSSQKIQPPAGWVKIAPGDLNFKAGGDYIYLCYQR